MNVQLEQWQLLANSDPWLVHRGRYAFGTFLLEVGSSQHLITIAAGTIKQIVSGSLVMPRWQFALRTSEIAWGSFCTPIPPPGFHDLIAMVRFGTLKLEGDQHLFMSNLLYFKDLFSRARAVQ